MKAYKQIIKSLEEDQAFWKVEPQGYENTPHLNLYPNTGYAGRGTRKASLRIWGLFILWRLDLADGGKVPLSLWAKWKLKRAVRKWQERNLQKKLEKNNDD